MTHELGKVYIYNNHYKVKLNAIWYENDVTWAAATYLEDRNYAGKHIIVHLNSLMSKTKIKQRINLTLHLTKDNELEVHFDNRQIPEQEKVNYLQTSFDLMVENEEV